MRFVMIEKPSPDPFKEFEARLKRAQDGSSKDDPQDGTDGRRGVMRGLGQAFRVSTELVAALMVGVGIGYVMDVLAGTAPFGLILGFFLGAGAGALNVYRVAAGLGGTPGFPRKEDGRQGSGSEDSDRTGA